MTASMTLAIATAARAVHLPANLGTIRSNAAPCVKVRTLAWWLLRRKGWSYPRIAQDLGGYDHSTVLHGVRRVEEWRREDPIYRANTDAALQEFGVYAMQLSESPRKTIGDRLQGIDERLERLEQLIQQVTRVA